MTGARGGTHEPARTPRPHPGRARRRAFLKVAVFIVAVSLPLLLAEVLARLTYGAWPFEPATFQAPNLEVRDRSLGWLYSKGADRNSLGLRNREVGPKPPGTLRILVLGDSLVYMSETSSGRLYTQVLEERLNAAEGSSGRKVEVVNAGIPGYNTWQELEFLRLHGLDMNPDLLVLGFVVNDVYNPSQWRLVNGGVLQARPECRCHRIEPDAFPGAGLLARSYVANVCWWSLEETVRKLRGQPVYPFETDENTYYAWKRSAWPDESRLLLEMRDMLRARPNPIPMGVVAFPLKVQVDPKVLALDRDRVLFPQEQVEEICKKQGMSFLDLAMPLVEAGGDSLYKDDLHLNGFGNDVVATQLTAWLRNRLGEGGERAVPKR